MAVDLWHISGQHPTDLSAFPDGRSYTSLGDALAAVPTASWIFEANGEKVADRQEFEQLADETDNPLPGAYMVRGTSDQGEVFVENR